MIEGVEGGRRGQGECGREGRGGGWEGIFQPDLADVKQVHSLLKPWHDDGWEEQDGAQLG